MPWRANKLQPFRLQSSQSDNNSNSDSVDFGDWDFSLAQGLQGPDSPNFELEVGTDGGQHEPQQFGKEVKPAASLSQLGAKRIVKGPSCR